MDTREKIVSLPQLPALLATGKWQAITGYFDPLTPAQIERLAAASHDGRKLLAIVDPARNTLLPAEARAQLLASLRMVHAVVIASRSEWQPALHPGSDLLIDDDLSADAERSAGFTRFVLARQACS